MRLLISCFLLILGQLATGQTAPDVFTEISYPSGTALTTTTARLCADAALPTLTYLCRHMGGIGPGTICGNLVNGGTPKGLTYDKNAKRNGARRGKACPKAIRDDYKYSGACDPTRLANPELWLVSCDECRDPASSVYFCTDDRAVPFASSVEGGINARVEPVAPFYQNFQS